MKRHGNLFCRIAERENLDLAYKKARKGKGWQDTIKDFEKDLDANLDGILESLLDHSYTTSEYRIKRIYEPKERDIYILPFAPDRIVQHAIMNVVEPIWDNIFYFHSYACRTGKGIHPGSLKVMEYIRQNEYCLKMDISKFYPSISHDIIFEIVQHKIKCPGALWLLRDIIYSVPGGYNIPIGNYTSQWLGNLYMNEVDSWIKHEHRMRHYIRYCDDFCLFSNDKAHLRFLASEIEAFLWSRLHLKFSKCDLFPVSRGVDFLGYRHFPQGYILLRKSTSKRVKRRLARLPYLYRSGRITLDQYRSSVASTWGWMRWANTYNFQVAVKLVELQEDIDEQSKAA